MMTFSIKRVVWAANDGAMGAMRKLSEESLLLDQFKNISIEAAPYRDLEVRQRKLMADFNTSRGYLSRQDVTKNQETIRRPH